MPADAVVVDILLGASSLQAIERRIDRLRDHFYAYVPEFEAVLPHRRDARLFHDYLALKRALAAKFSDDREAYCDAKAPFIQEVLRRRVSRQTPAGAR